MVREIDALGGEMAINTDVTAIQFRLLNASKGPAVHGPRAQCDKKAYQFRMKHVLELQPNLTLFQALVTALIFEGDAVVGVRTNLDLDFYGRTVVVTTGTFLRGLMHIGRNKNEGGRLGDFSAKSLSGSFLEAGIELERLKTGTPPRILGSTIDFSKCREQPGDASADLLCLLRHEAWDGWGNVPRGTFCQKGQGSKGTKGSKEVKRGRSGCTQCSTWNIGRARRCSAGCRARTRCRAG